MTEEQERKAQEEETGSAGPAPAAESAGTPAEARPAEPAPPAEVQAAAEVPPEAAPEAPPQPGVEKADKKAEEEDIEVSYEVTTVGPSRRKVAVTIQREVFDKELDKQLKELQTTIVTPGFRKGRAPRRIIERRYAKAVREEVKRTLAARGLQKALTQAELEPLGEPQLGEPTLADDGPLTIDATMDVRPKVVLKDYKGLAVTKRAVSVGEKEIDQAVKALLERRGRLVPVVDPAATAAQGDLLAVDYRVTAGDQTLLERTDVTVPMALRQFPEVPELAPDRLLGAKVGETVETAFELQTDRWPPDLRGRPATLAVTVHEIKRLELPELTEETLKEFGAESAEDLRARLEMMLLRDLEREVQREVEEQLERQLLEQADFELPESLVAEQAAGAASRTRLRLMELGVPEEDLDARAEELASQSRSSAERELKLHFLLQHIAEEEQIEVEPADLERHLAQMAANYGISPRQVRLWLEKEDRLGLLRLTILERKVLDWLLEQAQVTEQEPQVDVEAVAPEGT